MPEFQTRLQNALGDDYVIERELGGGGMSRVFVAVERSLQRKVVIKVLPPDLSVGVNIERFRREIQLAAQLQHPHIVPLLTASEDRELLWFTMPFIEGASLRRTLERVKQMAPRDVVRILHDIVDALAYAHARGVVHRDIKPDNILTSGVHAMVTDFGVAKALSAAIPVAGGTTTGMAIGTPAYMAPEQLAADPAADHRVDVYAVGLLAYELLTGQAPFKGTTPQATLAAQLTVMPEAPHLLLPEVPESLSTIVMRCLEKDASKRFQSAAELLAALDALPPLSASTARSPFRMARTRRRVAGAVVGILVVLAGIMTAQRVGDFATRESAGRDGAKQKARQDSLAQRTKRNTDTAVLAHDVALDNSRATSVPVVITRAESLAIAAAIHNRMMPQRPAASDTAAKTVSPSASTPPATPSVPAMTAPSVAIAPNARISVPPAAGGTVSGQQVWVEGKAMQELKIDREQMLAEVRRVFSDSFRLAMTRVDSTMSYLPKIVRMQDVEGATTVVPMIAPPTKGATRVVVTPFLDRTGNPELASLGMQLSESIRAALSRVANVEVPGKELTHRAAAGGDRLAAGGRLRADYVISGELHQRGDSLLLVTRLNDVRSGMFNRAAQLTVPFNDPERAIETLSTRVASWLDTARTSPRPWGPGGPATYRAIPGARGHGGSAGRPPVPPSVH